MFKVGGLAVSTVTGGRNVIWIGVPADGAPAFALNVSVPAVVSSVNEVWSRPFRCRRDAATGDVLALVNAPEPDPRAGPGGHATPGELLDRARYGEYPPGSTFKLVTAIAALRLNPELKHRTFLCGRLPDGRAGNTIAGWNRPIKDDIGDVAHGTLDMQQAIAVLCNAYFAQLGVHDVGSKALAETAAQFGISTGDPAALRHDLPFASYGQGAVLVSPFKMARVAAAIAAGVKCPRAAGGREQLPERCAGGRAAGGAGAGARRRIAFVCAGQGDS